MAKQARSGLVVTRRSVSSLAQDPSNARKHNEKNLAAIKASLTRFGQQKPIVIDSSGVVRAGNGTLAAAQALGWSEIDCVVSDLQGAEAAAYAIADNRTAELAEWDDAVLTATLQALEAEDASLLLDAGYDEKELAKLVAANSPEVVEDEVPEPPADPVTKPGDLWLLGEHRLLCGDSTKAEDVARLLEGRKPFIMVTDPPYGVEYDPTWRHRAGINKNDKRRGAVANDERADWTAAYNLFAGAVAYVWHGDRDGFDLDVGLNLRAAGFDLRSRIIWRKPRFALSQGHYHWQHECARYAVRASASASSKWCGDRSQSTVWDIAQKDGGEETTHGTQKPIECMARPIRNHGGKDDDVYDPFLGSGTTLIAAEQLGRKCYGLEIDPGYCDVIVARWEKLTGKKATLEQ